MFGYECFANIHNQIETLYISLYDLEHLIRFSYIATMSEYFSQSRLGANKNSFLQFMGKKAIPLILTKVVRPILYFKTENRLQTMLHNFLTASSTTLLSKHKYFH
jgi:hypothetical protein